MHTYIYIFIYLYIHVQYVCQYYYRLTEPSSTVWLQITGRYPSLHVLVVLLISRSANGSDEAPLVTGDIKDFYEVTSPHLDCAFLLPWIVSQNCPERLPLASLKWQ